MMAVGGGARQTWFESEAFCDKDFVNNSWWRIPIYLFCSVAVLGQYRMPLDRYWLGLAVQLVAYEVQYQVFNGIGEDYTSDNLDTVASNIAGAVGGVLCACALSWFINLCRGFYSARILQADDHKSTAMSKFVYRTMRCFVHFYSCLGIGRKSDILKLGMADKLRDQSEELNDPTHPRDQLELHREEENLFLETIVGLQSINSEYLSCILFYLCPA